MSEQFDHALQHMQKFQESQAAATPKAEVSRVMKNMLTRPPFINLSESEKEYIRLVFKTYAIGKNLTPEQLNDLRNRTLALQDQPDFRSVMPVPGNLPLMIKTHLAKYSISDQDISAYANQAIESGEITELL